MIGLGPAIPDVAEFNRRASFAIRVVDFGTYMKPARDASEFRRQQAAGAVTPEMQLTIFNLVHRYRKQITDKAVTEYAASRARGAD